MEPLEADTLYLAATRPAMFMGVPLSLGAMLLMLAGLIVVLFKNPLYLTVMAPLWLAAHQQRQSARAGDDDRSSTRSLLIIGGRCGRAARGLWRWPGG